MNVQVSAPNIDWMSGKVGTIQRDSSGKLVRNGNLTLRGPDYIREYDAPRKGQKVILLNFKLILKVLKSSFSIIDTLR